jgi:photosystem II stability/assembly factor-like uncharacterized protein
MNSSQTHTTFLSPRNSTSRNQQSSQASSIRRRSTIESAATLLLLASGYTGIPDLPSRADSLISVDWEKIDIPVASDIVLMDIGFVDEKRGFIIGTKLTLLETDDGGKTWVTRDISANLDETVNYRLNSIDFNATEGWIVGKPPIILHTSDAGQSWERIPLSAKLPGNALKIIAGEKGNAEMITDQGAVYTTNNTGQSWKAALQETVDATLNRTVSSGISGASFFEGYFSNVSRAEDGTYVAVSSRGNFFLTWAPGESNWKPHNRPTGRRIQNMGWKSGKLWLTTRGGQVLIGNTQGVCEDFTPSKLQSRGFGILDVGFRTNSIGYACGGSGSLYKTEDGGEYWKRDRAADNVAGNLYTVKFVSPSSGFILGNNGILLRYIGSA